MSSNPNNAATVGSLSMADNALLLRSIDEKTYVSLDKSVLML